MNYKVNENIISPDCKDNGLSNVAHNIYKKMFELKITLPDIAKMIGIEYQTLWRITEQKDGYNPNFKALTQIANFFNVTVSDLLRNPFVGQYIPILKDYEVEPYLSHDVDFDSSKSKRIFCEEKIHQDSFAVEVSHGYFGQEVPITYVFRPYDKPDLNKHLLFKFRDLLCLGLINAISKSSFKIMLISERKIIETRIDEVKILALAVKQILNNDLI